MGIVTTTCTKESELIQILSLQSKNSPENLSSGEKTQEGFVTVSHNLELLNRMNAVCPHIIAKDGAVVVGYALCMHPNFGLEIEILKPMIAEINSLLPPPDPYIIMGQICIDKSYRKKGIFRELYKTMKQTLPPQYKRIITEVDTSNPRSLNAHYAVGFTDLKTYVSGKHEWKLIELQ
ncbi:GNAT family N-acetyltransferase [Arenibacter certesii]|uniref:N-acetyltransferase domain-containing protein n=1 Tax=Arenibacter certesii TaxID=228955 RepID=A0A918J4E3_9FLAO|nr:GNAT family N-acetyltransferase [Arenibacter certesii]GGW46841.1 hypothetical protein GCM10007383_33890 [Arenibacter certesii]